MSPVREGAPVGVVGAGTRGVGIALLAARAGHPVRVLDVRPDLARRAVEAATRRLRSLAECGRWPRGQAVAAEGRLTPVAGSDDLTGCEVVVEAVVEDLEVKRALLAELERVVDERCMLGTNTSSLSVTALAAGLRHPERLVGLHFFNPADRMRLVEVVRGDATDPSVVEAAADLARAWDKTPVVCASTPGFVVNRVARPYYGEAQRLVEERVADPATVDAVLREAGGFPLGPFALADLVGQDVNLAVTRSVWEQTFHDPRYAPTVLQQRLVDGGRLGRKTGRGVFSYDEQGRATDATPATERPRPAPPRALLHTFEGRNGFDVMEPLLDRVAAGGVVVEPVEVTERGGELPTPGIPLPGGGHLCETYGLAPSACYAPDGRPFVVLDWAHDAATCTRVALSASADCPAESLDAAVGLCQAAGVAVSVVGESPGGIVARTVAMLVNEAVELVGRGEASAEDVDVAMILGTGYPSGPLEWGERPGVDAPFILERLHEVFPTGRYRPSPLFERAERAGLLLREL